MIELPPDYIPKPGDVIKSVYRGVNNQPIPADDSMVISSLYSYSTAEVEERVYRQTGVRIKIRNRRAEVIVPGRDYRYEIEYEIVEASTPPAVVVAASIIAVIAAIVVALYFIDWFLEKNLKVETPAGEVDLRGIFLILVVIAVIAMFLRRR